ncbi:DgyrCDS13320 [Dimorphilus gyrociliatus]|uniref:DgyrCDS13320 n=1 Tax=Dimorphilus gyrociliatus TaxID=2664684 RepID=A0A7I8WAD1_9ANNE|nr:DgyrCDS13320 [Dimorphilus gyrociliatus]
MATLILDNGAYEIKVGYTTDENPLIIPNCIYKAKHVRTRSFIGDLIKECKDLTSLYYMLPFQRGFLTNWDLEKQIWSYMFSKPDIKKVDYEDCNVIITEPYMNLVPIQDAMDEILFEEFQFNRISRVHPSDLSFAKYQAEKVDTSHLKLIPEKDCIIIDSGYSFTHIIPYVKGTRIDQAVCRINVGGKILTNHLKETISYRQMMMMSETYVVNQMKEDLCYVSLDFNDDLKHSRSNYPENKIVREYVLPDFSTRQRGVVRYPLSKKQLKEQSDHEQAVKMNNERFSIPELLFNPTDVGFTEMGIGEALVDVCNRFPSEIACNLYANILLTGATCKFPGFAKRLLREIEPDKPETVPFCGVFDVTE